MPPARIQLVMIGGVACDETLWGDAVGALDDVADCLPIVPASDTIEAMAAEVLARVSGPFALAGHSMGGYVALAIQRASPERVRRLALIGSGSSVEQPDQRKARLDLINVVKEKGFQAMLAKLVPAMVSAETRGNDAMMERLEAMVDRVGGDRFIRQQLAVMNRPEAQSALANLSIPVIVMAGRGDRIVAPTHGAETAERIPGAHFRLLERCGHIAPVERADAVSALLRAWLLDDALPQPESPA